MPSPLSALALYSTSGVSRLGIRSEEHLLLAAWEEAASRTQIRITGVSGCTVYLAEVDPILQITLRGWVLRRSGLANAGPGSIITPAMLNNFSAPDGSAEDHFGWNTGGDYMFSVRDPKYRQSAGKLHEIEQTLALECTATAGVSINGADAPPIVDGEDGDPISVTGLARRYYTLFWTGPVTGPAEGIGQIHCLCDSLVAPTLAQMAAAGGPVPPFDPVTGEWDGLPFSQHIGQHGDGPIWTEVEPQPLTGDHVIVGIWYHDEKRWIFGNAEDVIAAGFDDPPVPDADPASDHQAWIVLTESERAELWVGDAWSYDLFHEDILGQTVPFVDFETSWAALRDAESAPDVAETWALRAVYKMHGDGAGANAYPEGGYTPDWSADGFTLPADPLADFRFTF